MPLGTYPCTFLSVIRLMQCCFVVNKIRVTQVLALTDCSPTLEIMSTPYHPKSKSVPSSGFDAASASFDFSNVTNRGKVKTESGGDDDASHTPQVSHHSNGSKGDSDIDHKVDHLDGEVDEFMAQLVGAFSRMMKGEGSRKSKPKRQEPSIVLSSGMGFRLSEARSRDEIRTGCTIVKRTERGTSSESPAKFIRKVCVKLENPLKLPPWEEILDSSSDLDLGTAIIDVQTQIEGVVEFYVSRLMCTILQTFLAWTTCGMRNS
jgi:hypothetical protein